MTIDILIVVVTERVNLFATCGGLVVLDEILLRIVIIQRGVLLGIIEVVFQPLMVRVSDVLISLFNEISVNIIII